ncbi:MAG TPA: hypothetical protein DDW36_00740 [Candidatus Magasanikbacteria bacterium]|nr:hypothetical protein [Candidatus Magasanikbacteria bacterium]
MKTYIVQAVTFMQNRAARIVLAMILSTALVLSLAPSMAQGQDLTPEQKITLGLDVLETPGTLALGQSDIRVTVARIINVALSLLGIIAVVVTLIGGFLWMTAGGNDEQIEKAKGWIFSGIIGLAIILSAFAIAQFVISKLGSATEVEAVG